MVEIFDGGGKNRGTLVIEDETLLARGIEDCEGVITVGVRTVFITKECALGREEGLSSAKPFKVKDVPYGGMTTVVFSITEGALGSRRSLTTLKKRKAIMVDRRSALYS